MATETSNPAPDATLPYSPRPKPNRGPISQILHGARRSFREAFSRESLISSLKSILWVGPLTVLIWIWAEREQLTSSKDPVPIPVIVSSSDPLVVIRIINPPNGRIDALLQGPRAKVDQVREELKRRGDSDGVRIDVDRNLGFGRQQISAGGLDSDPLFKRNGISLLGLQPRTLEVFVDRLEDVQADVVAPANLTNVTGVVFDTPRVKLSAPKTLLDAAPKPLKIEADIASLPQSRTPGRHENLPVRLVPPFTDSNARLTPSTVNVTFEVRQTSGERKFDSIPIGTLYPPGMEERYIAKLTEGSIANVTVVGPADIVRAMEPPIAILRVTLDDVPQNGSDRAIIRKPTIELPDGVKLKDPTQQPTVEFRVIEREL